MIDNLSSLVPINIIGTISGTVASGIPTSIFSKATIQNVILVTEDPIPVNIVGNSLGGGIGSRVQGVSPSTDYTGSGNTIVRYTSPDAFDTDNWHDHTAGIPGDQQFTVPAGEDGLYLIVVEFTVANFQINLNDWEFSLQLDPTGGSGFSTIARGPHQLGQTGSVPAGNFGGGTVTAIRELSAGAILRSRVDRENSIAGVTSTFTIIRFGDTVS